MFTIKQVYGNKENYQVWCATSYFVDRTPPAGQSIEGSVRDPDNAIAHLALPEQSDPDLISPRITMTLADRTEETIDVIGEVYIENAAGKTIDVIRPRLRPGPARG